jgi:hypothetical protein
MMAYGKLGVRESCDGNVDAIVPVKDVWTSFLVIDAGQHFHFSLILDLIRPADVTHRTTRVERKS